MIETKIEDDQRRIPDPVDGMILRELQDVSRSLQVLKELIVFVDALPLTTVDRHAWERLLAKLGRSER